MPTRDVSEKANSFNGLSFTLKAKTVNGLKH